jgi:hypothetical protein
MNIMGVAMMAAMVWTSVPANAVSAAETQVVVCMTDTDLGLESRAKSIASAILASIDVKIQWHSPRKCPAEAIFITLSNDQPASLLPGALAYALPFEGTHVVVFYDRVKNDRVKSRPGTASSILGHVIAHEITHILQGAVWHSESGIMRAQWTRVDYQDMLWKPLQFTDEDVMRIQRGLKGWEARRASSGSGRGPVARQ